MPRRGVTCFAALLLLKTVGFMGDGRSYGDVIFLRVVESMVAMAADWFRFL